MINDPFKILSNSLNYCYKATNRTYEIPSLYLKLRYFKPSNSDTKWVIVSHLDGDKSEIVRIPYNLRTITTWNKWKYFLDSNNISIHSPLYRVIQYAFTDGFETDAEDGEYLEVIEGYHI